MSDLISRSDTTKRLRNYAEQKHYNGEVELANGILKAICFIEYEENIPTAYDVDKVSDEINMNYRKVQTDEDLEWNRAISRCDEIVRKGGVE